MHLAYCTSCRQPRLPRSHSIHMMPPSNSIHRMPPSNSIPRMPPSNSMPGMPPPPYVRFHGRMPPGMPPGMPTRSDLQPPANFISPFVGGAPMLDGLPYRCASMGVIQSDELLSLCIRHQTNKMADCYSERARVHAGGPGAMAPLVNSPQA